METNPELELAFDFIQLTNKNIFLTGKAGTGKTTFLHRVQAEIIKRTVVVAPTGVAAINARGMTIHSFFQMPFGPFIPGNERDPKHQRKFARKKIKLIKSLDLLIIDEISMVRADLLDGIDDVLRRYKNPLEPFGGVQLLMIGDLHQLPPVVKHDEWRMLQEHYKTPYFFGSNALQKTQPITIQLTHIFRQADQVFIDLLNKVRDNQLDQAVLEQLNSRYIENFQPPEDKPYITLTSHNAVANKINIEKLNALAGKSYTFKSKVDGDFPPHAYPTHEVLEFKVGAQVLFIKNDTQSGERKYYNGKIGQITKIEGQEIFVRCPGDTELITVGRVEWENVKFKLNEESKEVEENVVGVFSQHPLKLAWAITIHKSQGLTFERAIIDAEAAFAHGQVYVALSRCKTFEGIVLRSKINYSSVKTDAVVQKYSKEADQNAPNAEKLLQSKIAYQQSLIQELFNFENSKRIIHRVHKVFAENENTLTTAALEKVIRWIEDAKANVFSISEKFQNQLRGLFSANTLPEDQEEIQERIQKGSVYFLGKINSLYIDLKKIPILTENQKLEKLAKDNLKNLEKELFIKKTCLNASQKVFSAAHYLKLKVNTELDFENTKTSKSKSSSTTTYGIPGDTSHPDLYTRIKYWRDLLAADEEVKPYKIIPIKTITDLTRVLPTDTATLLHVSGIGKNKIKKYGLEILKIVSEYCKERGIKSNLLTLDPAPPRKRVEKESDTKKKSYDYFRSGKTIGEIASIRGLARGTIEVHLSYYISVGDLNIFEIIDEEKVRRMEKFFKENGDMPRSEAKAKLGDEYSYGEINMVKKYLEKK